MLWSHLFIPTLRETPAEAEALLGPTRLRKHAKVIRPDLYGPAKGRAW